LLWINTQPERDRHGLIEFCRGHFFQRRDGIRQIVSLRPVYLVDGGAIAFTAISLHGVFQFQRAVKLS
jgi:hypothetical protein